MDHVVAEVVRAALAIGHAHRCVDADGGEQTREIAPRHAVEVDTVLAGLPDDVVADGAGTRRGVIFVCRGDHGDVAQGCQVPQVSAHRAGHRFAAAKARVEKSRDADTAGSERREGSGQLIIAEPARGIGSEEQCLVVLVARWTGADPGTSVF
ncbi:MAG: hypothetical protein KDK06_01185 [Gammaproteobacteria bacterium]|nr:hypothetical protein [Gammaproteobacteria bacterium]